MGAILGYARVSTGDQDVAGRTLRLEQGGAIKVFTNVKFGKSMDRPGLPDLIAYVALAVHWRSFGWIALAGRWLNCSKL